MKKKKNAGPPRILLGAGSLRESARVPRDRMLEVAERYREPRSLAVTLAKALDAGAEGVLATPNPALGAALSELGRRVPIYAVLPDLPPAGRYDLQPGRMDPLDDGSDAGSRGAGLAGARQAWRRVARTWSRQPFDFAQLVRRRIEAEAMMVPRRSLQGVVVASGATDLALAGGHRRFFERLVRFIHGRYRARAAFETLNLGVLLARLREWNVRPDFVIGPVNPCGVMMKPSAAATVDEIARSQVPVVANQLRATGLCAFQDGARFALEHGALGLAPDLAEMDDVGAELNRLRGWWGAEVPERLEGSRRA